MLLNRLRPPSGERRIDSKKGRERKTDVDIIESAFLLL